MTYRIRLEPEGVEFDAAPDQTILESALLHGRSLPFGCRNGFCGDCKGRVLKGGFRYADGYTPGMLLPEEVTRGLAILCKAIPESDMTIRVKSTVKAGDIPVRRVRVRVGVLERLSDDVIRLFLEQPAGDSLRFLAGQYINILLADGRARAFSIANAPHNEGRIELHLRHLAGGAFTDYAFSQMQVGEEMEVEGPLGQFVLREGSQRPMLFVAGGTGFAPIKGIIEHALEQGSVRPMHLYWGVRAAPDLYLDALPRAWAAEHGNIQYTPVLSEPAADWTGRAGFVHAAVAADYADLSAYDIYMAGPPVMIDAARAAFIANGADPERIFYDAFEVAAKKGA